VPRYNYLCSNSKCEHLFEVVHRMHETPEIKCPKCSCKAEHTLMGQNISVYVRGDGIVKDRAGAKRDMDLYHLTCNDPYAVHRVPGEKDELANRLRRGGKKRNSKTIAAKGLK